jgi:hypothetical protein
MKKSKPVDEAESLDGDGLGILIQMVDAKSQVDFEKKYYILHELLLVSGTKILRECFKSNWLHKSKKEWTDDASSGEFFWTLDGKARKEKGSGLRARTGASREALRSGDSSKWDLGLLLYVLVRSSVNPVEDPMAREAIIKMGMWRNILAHSHEFRKVSFGVPECFATVQYLAQKYAPDSLQGMYDAIKKFNSEVTLHFLVVAAGIELDHFKQSMTLFFGTG